MGMNIPEGYVLIKREEYEELLLQIKEQANRIKELEARMKLNSKNSHKPPSTDLFKSNQSLREKSGKKPGAQPGHKGSRLQMSSNPDYIEKIDPVCCEHCGGELGKRIKKTIRKQVFDIPEPKMEVTEYMSIYRKCTKCGRICGGELPAGVTQTTQYGNRIKAFVAYLSGYQMIPHGRLSQLIEDVYGIHLSGGMLHKTLMDCSEKLTSFREETLGKLIESPVVGFDETGINLNGKLAWIHTASTQNHTLLNLHEKRGKPAMDAFGLLSQYKGIAIHDRWASYFHFDRCAHALCNAHLLRELKYLSEDLGYKWAGAMKTLIAEAKKKVDKINVLSLYRIRKIEKRYSEIVSWGLRQCSKEGTHISRTGSRGCSKQSKAKNLIDAMKMYKDEFLKYLRITEVPFDNNQSERDIRMAKVKMKVSGGFRTWEGAKAFVNIRGYINTAIKNSASPLHSLTDLFLDKPFVYNSG